MTGMQLRMSTGSTLDPGDKLSQKVMKEILIGIWFGMLPAILLHLALGELFLAGCFSALFVGGAVLWCVALWWESFAAHRRAMWRTRSEERTTRDLLPWE